MATSEKSEHPSVALFREYLRIPSVHPNVNYEKCIALIKREAGRMGVPWMVHCCAPGKPVIVLTMLGQQPHLPSLLLNSHMDVVPAYPENWTYHPFAAEKDSEGNIFGRGAQDMKSIGIQYLEALRRLKQDRVSLKRTIHISFVPDEEVGGKDGMCSFVKTPEFRSLNIGCSLDEARSCPKDAFNVYYGERTQWIPVVTCTGETGHGSLFVKNTAAEKARIIMNRFLEWRQRESDKLDADPNLPISNVSTINLTTISGGVQPNIVPAKIQIGFDVRLSPYEDLKSITDMFDQFCCEAGHGTSIAYEPHPIGVLTPLNNNPWWDAFKQAAHSMGVNLNPIITPGASDSRYLRELGISAFGFSPMNNTPTLLHGNNEFLNEKVFLRGIDVYCEIIRALANS